MCYHRSAPWYPQGDLRLIAHFMIRNDTHFASLSFSSGFFFWSSKYKLSTFLPFIPCNFLPATPSTFRINLSFFLFFGNAKSLSKTTNLDFLTHLYINPKITKNKPQGKTINPLRFTEKSRFITYVCGCVFFSQRTTPEDKEKFFLQIYPYIIHV